MRRTSALWEVFVLRFEEAMERYRKRRLTGEEAGELLGMSGRHFRRLLVRHDEEGAEGLRDRRLGKASPRRAPAAELTRMQILYQERYRDFTVKHFHEQLVKRHGYRLGYTVTRLALQRAGLVAPGKRRGGRHRKKRERRPLPGMLLFQSLPPRRRGTARRTAGSPRSGPGGGGRHCLELSRTGRDDRPAGPVPGALYRPRLALLPHGLKPAARSTRPDRRRSAGRWRSSASRTSRPTRPRRAAAWNGRSARSRAACRPSCGSPGSPPSRPPTAIRGRSSCPTTTPASRCRRPARGRPVRPGQPSGGARQLRHLVGHLAADPAAAPPPPLRQGERAGARVPRRSARDLRRAGLPGPLRSCRQARRCFPGRLTPLGGQGLGLMDLWTTLRVDHNPTSPTTTAADI